MPRFNVYAKISGSKFLGEYEAKDADAAEEMAIEENGHVSLCHACSSECENAEIESVTVESANAR